MQGGVTDGGVTAIRRGLGERMRGSSEMYVGGLVECEDELFWLLVDERRRAWWTIVIRVDEVDLEANEWTMR